MGRGQAYNQEKFLRPRLELIYNLGPCLESLDFQTQHGTIFSPTVACAAVFNYGQSVENRNGDYMIQWSFSLLFPFQGWVR